MHTSVIKLLQEKVAFVNRNLASVIVGPRGLWRTVRDVGAASRSQAHVR